MGDKTEISWTDSTFNPWIGCTKVGPGCDNCYAEREFDHRHHKAKWGAGQERVRTSVHNWKLPLRWNAKRFMECTACGWRGELAAELCGCGSCGSIHHLNHARRRVFCASLADVFDNEVPAQWRADLFDLIAKTPNIDWLLLTKRIGNVSRMIAEATATVEFYNDDITPWTTARPWPHVWIGASICNQTEKDRDIHKLMEVPAAVRFISMEPLLGPVRLNLATPCDKQCDEFQNAECPGSRGLCAMQNAIDWVIVGGESGPKARPMHASWVYDLHDQCEAAGVPFLFKQWGEWVSAGARAFGTASGEVRHIRSDGSFWDEDDDALKDESADALTVVRVGKKAAGRDLHGEIHNEFPEVAP